MIPFNVSWKGRAQWVGGGLFILGVIATLVALKIPATADALHDLERSGYFGALVSGVLYAISLTAATATVVFANIPDRFNPVLIALVGGFGAMIYDLGIFVLTRRDGFRGRVSSMFEHFHHHPRLPRWLSYAIGAVLIASPLPDELGAVFFGFKNIPMPMFLGMSFSLNALGILVITGVF